MIDDRQEELAAAAAFDLLEGGEKAQFDGEMARNPDLRRRVEELREASAALAYLAPAAEPPAALRERILDSAASRKQQPAPQPVAPGKVLPFPLLVAWAAAACFAVCTAWMGQLYFSERNQNELMHDQQRLAHDELESMTNRMEAQRLIAVKALTDLKSEGDLAQVKIATLTSMLNNSPQALAVAVWDPKRQQGVLSVAKLPPAGPRHDYELWMIPAEQGAAPIPAGLIRGAAVAGEQNLVFRSAKPIETVGKFAISLERKGGASAPAGKIVLLSK